MKTYILINKIVGRVLENCKKFMKNYVYDLETYPNFFCGVFNCEGKELVYEISARKNDYEKLLKFYQNDINYAIGFNNIRFDAQEADALIAFNLNNSVGTQDMIRRAKAHGLKIREIIV